MGCSLPGSSVHEILQASILSGSPFPSPGHLPDPGINLGSPALQVDSLPAEPAGKPSYPLHCSVFFFLRTKESTLVPKGIIDTMDMSLGKLWEIVKNKEDWCAAVHGITKSWPRLSNEQQSTEMHHVP